MGLAMRSWYATLSDTELADHVSQLQRDFPNCGAEVYVAKHYCHFVVVVV